MRKSCSPEAMYTSAKGFMTLEEIHFHAAKMPNSISMDVGLQGHSHAPKSFTR